MNIYRKILLFSFFAFAAIIGNAAQTHTPAAEAAKLKDSKISISVEDIKNLGMRFFVNELYGIKPAYAL